LLLLLLFSFWLLLFGPFRYLVCIKYMSIRYRSKAGGEEEAIQIVVFKYNNSLILVVDRFFTQIRIYIYVNLNAVLVPDAIVVIML